MKGTDTTGFMVELELVVATVLNDVETAVDVELQMVRALVIAKLLEVCCVRGRELKIGTKELWGGSGGGGAE